MEVKSYLAFGGNCQEALDFYSDLFNAEIRNRQTYQDKKMDVPLSFLGKLQHAELIGKVIHIMAYDATPDTSIEHCNQIQMSIDIRDSDEAEYVFEELTLNGQIHHHFAEREWGYYGRCTDKYGINWIVKCHN